MRHAGNALVCVFFTTACKDRGIAMSRKVLRLECVQGSTFSVLRIAGVADESIVDGPGFRLSIFTQGCKRNCPDCQYPQSHSLDGGSLVHVDKLIQDYADNPLTTGVTFSGGEPFFQCKPLSYIATRVHELGGTVISYSGYSFEELLELEKHDPWVDVLLRNLDGLVEGACMEAERDSTYHSRGSGNKKYLTKTDMDKIRLQKIA